jgi:hypothetical protein
VPMLDDPQPTLRFLRNSSTTGLRNQPKAKIGLLNHLIYEVDPWEQGDIA